ncbi:hypothetical protein D3C83_117770 [compost metagenome]
MFAPGNWAIDIIPWLSSSTQPNSPTLMPYLPTQTRRVNSISMNANWLAIRPPCIDLRTPISGTRTR